MTTRKSAYRGFTEGSIFGAILRMGMPSLLGFAAANVYDIVDIFWLAKLGVNPPASITFFFAVYWVISSANLVAGTGSTSMISQYYGRNDPDMTEASIKETFLLKALLGIVFGAIGLAIQRPALSLLGAEGVVLEMATEYGVVQYAMLPFVFSAFTVYTAFRSIGNPKWAMALQLSSIAVNIILDPVLIFGWWIFPEMGIVGAAWASIIGYAFSVVIGLILLYSGVLNVQLHLTGKVRIAFSNMIRIMRIGLPAGISAGSWSLSRSIVMGFVAVYGTSVVAAYGIGNRVSAFGIMAIVGLGLGVSALIGQILGSERLERAYSTGNRSILLSMLIMTAFSLVVFFGAEQLMNLFFDESAGGAREAVHESGVLFLRIAAFAFPFIGVMITIEMVFSGAGKNVPPMVLSVLSNWVLEIPLILLFTDVVGMDELGVWIAMTFTAFIAAAGYYIYYRRKSWLYHRVRSTQDSSI